MKRAEITCGGMLSSLSDTDARTVRSDVAAALADDGTGRLQVNQGEGTPRETWILISQGVPFAVADVA